MRIHPIMIVLAASAASAATIAYRDASGRVVYQPEGVAARIVAAANGSELSLRPDGKALLYTRDEPSGPNRTLVLYDAGTGKSRDLMGGLVRSPLWSGDGAWIAFLRFDSGAWQLWRMPAGNPGSAARISEQRMMSLVGWAKDGESVVCFDEKNLYWMGLDGKAQRTLELRTVYGNQLQWMSSDHLRLDPSNPDRLAVSAFYEETPKGAPVDDMDLNSTIALADLKSGKRTIVMPARFWATDGEWSPDGAWIYYTRLEGRKKYEVWRMHPDGSAMERVASGSEAVAAE
jgi:Tol biopolymer transport system component